MIDVITPDGFKPITEVKEGDKLLTHKRRFRKVSEVNLIEVNELYRLKLDKFQDIIVPEGQEIYTYKQQRGDLFNFKPPSEIDKEHRVVIPLKGDVIKNIDDKKWKRFYKLEFDLLMGKIKNVSKLGLDRIIMDSFKEKKNDDNEEQIKYIKENMEDYPEIKEKVDEINQLKKYYPQIKVEQDNSYCSRGGLIRCYDKTNEIKENENERLSVLND